MHIQPENCLFQLLTGEISAITERPEDVFRSRVFIRAAPLTTTQRRRAARTTNPEVKSGETGSGFRTRYPTSPETASMPGEGGTSVHICPSYTGRNKVQHAHEHGEFQPNLIPRRAEQPIGVRVHRAAHVTHGASGPTAALPRILYSYYIYIYI